MTNTFDYEPNLAITMFMAILLVKMFSVHLCRRDTASKCLDVNKEGPFTGLFQVPRHSVDMVSKVQS